jgi:5-deoxy-glucuronate isomerase
MAELLVRSESAPAPGAAVVEVTPATAGWEHVGFAVHRLAGGVERTWQSPDRELCIVMLAGVADVVAGSRVWTGVGGRAGVFDGRPYAVYVPPAMPVRVRAVTDEVEIALCWAPAPAGELPAALITPDDIDVEVRGSGAAERHVHPILMEDRPAERLLVVEVLTPAGHWSSFPPHKHDRDDPPRETLLEETYYHRIRPEQGFALQRVYTDDGSIDETLSVADGDVVLVPRGYHTVSAPPGYDLYYLNVMAGPRRGWSFVDDPAHHWLNR